MDAQHGSRDGALHKPKQAPTPSTPALWGAMVSCTRIVSRKRRDMMDRRTLTTDALRQEKLSRGLCIAGCGSDDWTLCHARDARAGAGDVGRGRSIKVADIFKFMIRGFAEDPCQNGRIARCKEIPSTQLPAISRQR